MRESRWYLRTQNDTFGPESEAKLIEWAKLGRIQPGQEISFNQVTGPRGLEQGYQNAGVIQDDEIIDGPGGGVCQVCSTLYNIVLRVPAVIEEMNWHSQGGVSYLPSGFDATVGTNSDLIVRNVLPYTVRIEFESLDGVMTAFLFRDYEE